MVREVLLAHFVCLVAGGDDNEGAMVGCFFLFNAYFVCEFLEKMESTLPFAVQLTKKHEHFSEPYCKRERGICVHGPKAPVSSLHKLSEKTKLWDDQTFTVLLVLSNDFLCHVRIESF
jgi:hypothetical protein